MALITCPECKAEISSDAKTCPKCGALQPKRTSLATWIVGAIFLVVMFKTCSVINEKTAGIREEHALTAAAPPPPASWSYTSDTDKMTSKTTNFASVKSQNTLALERPYAGQNYGMLTIRKRSGKADEVIVSFDQGQSMCRSYSNDCAVSVRFDDAQPLKFAGQTPSDGSSKTVFLMPAAKFIAASRKTKAFKISLEIYQAGNQIFEFNTSTPLTWP